MQTLNEIEDLIKLISKLPGLGPRSARRIVLKLINNRDEIVKPMANALVQVYKNIKRCGLCGSLKSTVNGCQNCENCQIGKNREICKNCECSDNRKHLNANLRKLRELPRITNFEYKKY